MRYLMMNQRLGAGFLVIWLTILAMSRIVYLEAGGIETDVAAVSRAYEALRLLNAAAGLTDRIDHLSASRGGRHEADSGAAVDRRLTGTVSVKF